MSAILRVAEVRATLAPHDWAWAAANRDLIAAHWARRVAASPAMFNGRVLMVAGTRLDGEVVSVRFFATDYANLIAWVEHGFPDASVANGFAMGALRGRDGGFVLGRMGPHTANAGRLYFPCGTPDMSDVTASQEVDLASSLTREIGEETGLSSEDYAVEAGWTIVRHEGLLAFMRPVRLTVGAEAARARILAHIAADPKAELSGAVIVRGPADLDEARMPGVVPIYLRDAFAADQR